jgi:hypothetical protein
MSDMVVMLAITDHGSEPRAKPWLPGKSCLWFIVPSSANGVRSRNMHSHAGVSSYPAAKTALVQVSESPYSAADTLIGRM